MIDRVRSTKRVTKRTQDTSKDRSKFLVALPGSSNIDTTTAVSPGHAVTQVLHRKFGRSVTTSKKASNIRDKLGYDNVALKLETTYEDGTPMSKKDMYLNHTVEIAHFLSNKYGTEDPKIHYNQARDLASKLA